jgi:hypothetical protein
MKRDAEREALRVEQHIAEGRTAESLVSRGKTVAQVVEASLAASKAKLKPTTHAGYVNLYGTYILPVFGKQRIANVTSDQIDGAKSSVHSLS